MSALIPGMIPLEASSWGNGVLADRLVEQDHSADELLDTGRGEQDLAVGAPELLCRFEVDRVEPLLNGRVALVGGEDALTGGDERLRGLV
jgi:hypothetical protein